MPVWLGQMGLDTSYTTAWKVNIAELAPSGCWCIAEAPRGVTARRNPARGRPGASLAEKSVVVEEIRWIHHPGNLIGNRLGMEG